MTCERGQFILRTIRFDDHTLDEIMRVKFVGGYFLPLFDSRLNLCDKSKEQGNSGAFARLRTKA